MSETNFLPKDAADRKAAAPVICYPTHSLPQPDLAFYRELRAAAKPSDAVLVPPRRCFRCRRHEREAGCRLVGELVVVEALPGRLSDQACVLEGPEDVRA